MFLPLNLVAGPATILTFIAGAGAAIWALRKKIPHPTEFALIGYPFRCLGIHTHDKFDLLVDVQKATHCPKGVNAYVFVKSGRFEVQSERAKVDKETGEVDFFQRLPIHVRQKDNYLVIRVYSKTITSDLIGEYKFDVVKELINANFPRNQHIVLQRNGQNSARLTLSFAKVQPLPNQLKELGHTKLVEQAMLQGGEPRVDPDTLAEMSETHRMTFLSRVVQGPLCIMNKKALNESWDEAYFSATTTSKTREWVWCYWDSEQAFQKEKKPRGLVPFLAITAILPNEERKMRHRFFVRYKVKGKSEDLYLQRVDRDRDLWVEGLYEFTQLVRKEFERNPRKTESQLRREKNTEEANAYRKALLQTPLASAAAAAPLMADAGSTDASVLDNMTSWLTTPARLSGDLDKEVARIRAEKDAIVNVEDGESVEDEESVSLLTHSDQRA